MRSTRKHTSRTSSPLLRLGAIAALALGSLVALPVSAQDANGVCHVTKAGVHANNGATWDTAMDLGTALAATACAQVWVATGVYTPGTVVTDTFYINRAVAVYGGFAGTESAVAERVPGAYPTILSGVNHDDPRVNGVDETSVAIVPDNSYHVVTIDGATAAGAITTSTVIDGFIITAGYAPGLDGAGLFCDGSGSGHDCSPTIANVTFSGNLATGAGGGMYNGGSYDGSSSPHLTRVTFSGNGAGSGGAMANSGLEGESSPTLSNVTFTGNSAAQYGGAMANEGSGGASNPRMVNVTFNGNSAGASGGAIVNVADFEGSSTATLLNVILWGNTANNAGSEVYLLDVGGDPSTVTPTISFTVVQGGSAGIDFASGSGDPFSGGPGNRATDPLLGSLADNGGFTATLLPGNGGSAIDHGTCDGAPTFDQRGFGRAQGPRCDIGAVEVEVIREDGRCVVDQTAVGANDGSSWTDAYLELTAALQDASCTEVWVANGVYKPGSARTDSFKVKPGTKVYGGFAGGETSLAQRNPAANLTVLSGDIDNNDTGAGGVDATVANIVGSNSNHIITLDGTTGTPITASTELDGFTVTGGDSSSGSGSGLGGGLLCNGQGSGHECNPSLTNIVFSGNSAIYGGAIYAWGHGGGISSPILTAVTFSGNTAVIGGAIYSDGTNAGVSSPILTNVTFSGNSAAGGYALLTNTGGAMYNNGNAGTVSPSLTNVTFSGNSAEAGGAIYNFGPNGGNASLVLLNVIFWDDAPANTGLEIYSVYSDVPSIDYSIVLGGDAGIYDSSGATAFSSGAGNLATDPLLGALADNGGSTQTLKPGSGSSAIDHGTCTGAPLTDQRGIARPQGATCDIGAVEVGDDVIFANGFD